MPELPEVETVARTLRPQAEGRCIGPVALLREKTLQAGRELLPLLSGALVRRVHRRAKLVLIDLESSAGPQPEPLVLAFHLKMTGQLFIHDLSVAPHKHSKLIFDLHAPAVPGPPVLESRLFFDDSRAFGYCRLMRPADFVQWDFWNGLGLEPLDHTPEVLAQSLSGRGGSIKGLLLNQGVIAGIGNIYADESLFRAGIRPDARASHIQPESLLRLAQAVQQVLQESIDDCGSSIRDYRDANGNAGAFQNRFNVYGRGGEACPVCGRPLTRTKTAGRGTVFCEKCQK